MRPVNALAKRSVAFAWLLFAAGANASVGLVEVSAKSDAGPITIFYPSRSQAAPVRRGAFEFEAAENGTAAPGNGRLVVISHGSPASPWVYSDLVRTLVEAGFVVVMPEHFADNYKDDSEPGPPSWKRRPLEVSRSIDAIAADPRFGPMLKLDKVGMYGMSAGGHTALTLAGGRWSPARLRQHCQANIAEDFQACAGLSMRLTGGLLDRLKITLVRAFVSAKLTDDTWYGHTDPRIVAIVAGVPFAADFDPASLQAPPVSLGIVTARQDKWLVPKFHSDAILKACSSCEQLGSLPTGGHGALLSPLPPARTGLVAELISDPPGFDRAGSVPEVNRTISAFFVKHLLSGGSGR